jgi:hypothetical protein
MEGAHLCAEKDKPPRGTGQTTVALRSSAVAAAPAPAGSPAERGGMGSSSRGLRWACALCAAIGVLGPLLGAQGCGANIQAVYEGDVYFEHCMSLDAATDAKPAVQRTCWSEWLAYYTYGQTRDRVHYAEQRALELGATATLVVADAGPAVTPLQAPAPLTGLLAPASSTGLPDAGPAPPTPGITHGGADAGVPGDARARCRDGCTAERNGCRRQCRKASCVKACVARHSACLAECVP